MAQKIILAILVIIGIIIDGKQKMRQFLKADTFSNLSRYSGVYLHNGLKPHRGVIIPFFDFLFKGSIEIVIF